MPNSVEFAVPQPEAAPEARRPSLVQRQHLSNLIGALLAQSFEIIGPQVREGAIVYDQLTSLDQLPVGWIDQQSSGRYRLERGPGTEWFGYTAGAHSWKGFLYPDQQCLVTAERLKRSFSHKASDAPESPYAFFGVRSCDLHAIELYDRIFLRGPCIDPDYKRRREACFIVAVNCGRASGTCFCASMNTGPRATSGYDLVLTELPTEDAYRYLVEVGSTRGAELLAGVPHQPAAETDMAEAETLLAKTSAHMGRSLDVRGLKETLYRNFDHPMWDRIEERCLSCANCTMVCPTCFCTTVEDTTNLPGSRAERWRRWDSCFTLDFSYIHGGGIRVSTKSRFRQWMTHKLAAWVDQFGSFGCVGCGRCITWCPVGIDITAEARTLQSSDMSGPEEFSRSTYDSSNP
jgi:sulfhydrogenase subunit beta (sulfur reductase)